MKLTFRPLYSRPNEAWVELDGADQRVRVRNHVDGGRNILNASGQVEVANVSEDEIVAYVVERRRQAEEKRLYEIEEMKARCGYVQPPADLVPLKGPEQDSAGWDRLHAWFSERTKDPGDAVLVALAEQRGWRIIEAYVASDGWAKRRSPAHFPGGYN